ncbi:cytochrome C [Siphonobacter sp. BAB-5385]|uniref:Cytochrome C n=1 Tax=Siphonobacter curvatus TaxID=2094562 RepID=A0A2S7IS71_9BACT|nr:MULTISPECIES: c-type cytochrome [Siphonobacter]OZI08886.1 cytochrome C [Siphonobacter sp. BAB-5385]PMD96670.1 cytochrome C [Siphonobacter sp. BAB-5405]PQA60526.1 cytochrome C [Siphonobacter curvatus]
MNKTLLPLLGLVAALFVGTDASAQSKTDPPAEIKALLEKNICLTCHKVNERLVGPAYTDVAKKKYKPEQIVELIYKPKPSNWPGYPPMAPMTQVPKEDAMKIAKWIVSLNAPAKKK